MGIGLPKLEISFRAAAQEVANRSKRGYVAVIVRDTKAQGVHELSRASEIPLGLGEGNRLYLSRAFVGGKDLGKPSKVVAVVVPPEAEAGTTAGVEAGLELLTGKSVDYLAGPPDLSPAEGEKIKAWTVSRRAAYDTVKAVLPNTEADDKGIINFATGDIKVGALSYTAAEYASRIAGVLAGVPQECSATSAVLSEVTAVPRLTQEEQAAAINAGKLILIHDGVEAYLARGVNSMTTVSDGAKEDWKKIKLVEGMDLITYFARTTITKKYRGKCANSYDNKCLLLVALDTFHKELEGAGVLVKGSSSVGIAVEAQENWLKSKGVETSGMSEQQIKEADTGSWVFLAGKGTLQDAMEDFVLNYSV